MPNHSHHGSEPCRPSTRRAASRRDNHGCATTITNASTIRIGTTALNAFGGNTSKRMATVTAPSTDAVPNRQTRARSPPSSTRYPIAPNNDPGTSPNPLDTLAVNGGYPTASNTGKVISVPEPTTVLMSPAATPAAATATACNGCTV